MKNKDENFIFCIFDHDIFDDLKPQDVTRLMYLATYIEYKTNRLPLNKSEIANVVGINRSSFSEFFNDITEKGYLFSKDDNLYLNTKIFHKGKIKKSFDYSEKRFIRVYINAFRSLYETVKVTDHVYLGYIIGLLPYINIQWNIVCHNPLEQDKDKIIPMAFGDFCDLIGYGKSNLSRLLKVYNKIKFHWRDKEQLFAAFIYRQNKADMKIFINPHVFYAGDNFDKIDF